MKEQIFEAKFDNLNNVNKHSDFIISNLEQTLANT